MAGLTYTQIGQILLRQKYRFAKSMPKFPHWYTMRDSWDSDLEFQEVVQYIRDHGYPVKFFRSTYIYLDINGMSYWTMGAPIGETILINRAAVKSSHVYDKIAQDYDAKFSDPAYDEENRRMFGYLPDAKRVLDIGCGTGTLLDYLEPEHYVGIDPSLAMLQIAAEKHPKFAGDLINCGIERYVTQEKFDLIVAMFGVGSYIHPDQYDRIKDMLDDGGKAYLVHYSPSYTPVTYELGISPERYPFPKSADDLIIDSNYWIQVIK